MTTNNCDLVIVSATLPEVIFTTTCAITTPSNVYIQSLQNNVFSLMTANYSLPNLSTVGTNTITFSPTLTFDTVLRIQLKDTDTTPNIVSNTEYIDFNENISTGTLTISYILPIAGKYLIQLDPYFHNGIISTINFPKSYLVKFANSLVTLPINLYTAVTNPYVLVLQEKNIE